MRDALKDVVKTISSFGCLPEILVTGTDTETLFECMTDKQEVVLKARLNTPVPELKGQFGMTNLTIIKGLLDYPAFMEQPPEVVRETRQGVERPIEVLFRDSKKRHAAYRFTPPELMPKQPNIAPLKWDVEFAPTNEAMKELSSLVNIFSAIDPQFMVKTQDGELRFYIGGDSSSNHRTYVTMAEVTGPGLSKSLNWGVGHILGCFKVFQETNDPKISIISRGYMKIEFSTEFAQYMVILPARIS